MRSGILSVICPVTSKAITQPFRTCWASQTPFLRILSRPVTTTATAIPRPRTSPPPSRFVIHKRPLTMSSDKIPDRYKLIFYVPHSHLEPCKEAVFAAGAGVFSGGKYSKCCFQMPGQGQFQPGDGANPAIGSVGALEYVEEMKVEVMCVGRSIMLNAVEELVKAHPYEEVAYEVYKMENV
ncbi:uncharacterized protein ACHE_50455S [Aspergillus chevalieri]|uniref:ATP phosphoribosyltransferase n=1 Tax=Aspergillus chevalieri TaxID=182096 RepID=A0A7R7VR97_ASPCH|nr:uncharacterized protein ACHE_50455S [Aspergillus chevalieri]BCR89257.1 hypothetical protein ACHE_50455S [Aspergillus chevalieri]